MRLLAMAMFASLVATPASAWIANFDGTGSKPFTSGGNEFVDDFANDVAVDGSDDVIVGGALNNKKAGTDFTVWKLSGDTGAELWRYSLDGTAEFDKNDTTPAQDEAVAVGTDSNGDVFAAGFLTADGGLGRLFAVIKLDGTDGTELFRHLVADTPSGFTGAFGLAVLPNDDVVACGAIDGGTPEFAVRRIDGTSATTDWTYRFAGAASAGLITTRATKCAVDASGDVFAAGIIDNGIDPDPMVASNGSDFAVVKLDGATGAEDWKREIDGSDDPADDAAVDLVVTSGGDAIVVGVIDNAIVGDEFSILRLDGTAGTTTWSTDIDGTETLGLDEARSVALDSNEDIIVGGVLDDNTERRNLIVVKLALADGAQVWSREIDGGALSAADRANGVAVDPSDDVLVAGVVENDTTGDDIAIVKLQGSDGAVVWQSEFAGTNTKPDSDENADEMVALAVNSSGDPIAVGFVKHKKTDIDMAAVRLNNSDGALGNQGVPASKIQIKNNGTPSKRKILFGAKGPEVLAPTLGGPEDPRCTGASGGGGTLTVFSTDGSGESASFSLPCDDWETVGPERKRKGYQYKDKDLTNSACGKVSIKNGNAVKVVCNAKNHPVSPIDYTLGGGEGSVGIRLDVGGMTYCTEFDPATGAFVTSDDASAFAAKNGPTPSDCPAAP